MILFCSQVYKMAASSLDTELDAFLQACKMVDLKDRLKKNGFTTLEKLKIIIEHKDAMYHLIDISIFEALSLYGNLQKYVDEGQNKLENVSASINTEDSQPNQVTEAEPLREEQEEQKKGHKKDSPSFSVKTKRCGITKRALVEAATEDDLAAEYNEQLNEYNRLILQMIQENFELHRWQGSGGLTCCWQTDPAQAYQNQLVAKQIAKHPSVKKFYKSYGNFGDLNEKTTIQRIGARMSEHRKKLKRQFKGEDVKSYLDPRIFAAGIDSEMQPSDILLADASNLKARRKKRLRTSTPMKRCLSFGGASKMAKSCTGQTVTVKEGKEKVDEDKEETYSDKENDSEQEREREKSDQVNSEEENQPKPESELTEEQKEIREALHLEQECDLMKKRRANMDENEMFMAKQGLPVIGEKARLVVLFYCKSRTVDEVDKKLLEKLGKELCVQYNSKLNNMEDLLSQIGKALLEREIVKKVDPDTVISRTNLEVCSRELLEKCKKELSKEGKNKKRTRNTKK